MHFRLFRKTTHPTIQVCLIGTILSFWLRRSKPCVHYVGKSAAGFYFEIGSGNSTKFARHAIKLGDLRTKVMSIDPAPRAEIDLLCDKTFRMRLEDSDHQIFSILQAGDVLFFDGSHRFLTNSDVAVFFLRSYQASHLGFWSIFMISFYHLITRLNGMIASTPNSICWPLCCSAETGRSKLSFRTAT